MLSVTILTALGLWSAGRWVRSGRAPGGELTGTTQLQARFPDPGSLRIWGGGEAVGERHQSGLYQPRVRGQG